MNAWFLDSELLTCSQLPGFLWFEVWKVLIDAWDPVVSELFLKQARVWEPSGLWYICCCIGC